MLSISFILVFFVAICSWVLGLITLISNPNGTANRRYGMVCLLLGIYVLDVFAVDGGSSSALVYARIAYALGAVALLWMALFVNRFPRKVLPQSAEYAVIALGILVAGLSLTPQIISNIIYTPNGVNDVAGGWFPVFYAYVLVVLAEVVWSLVVSIKKNHGLDRVRVWYVAVGLIATSTLIITLNLVVPVLTGSYALSKYSAVAALFFLITSFVAIVRHRLFDIRLVIARSVMYFMLLVTLAAVYATAMFGFTLLFFKETNLSTQQNAVYVGMAIVLAFTFQPLRRFFEKITNRIFFRDSYDSQAVINDFTKILVSERELDHILKLTITELCEKLHIGFGQLVIFNNGRVYRIEHYGQLPQRLMIAPELQQLDKPMLVADEMRDGERLRLLKDHGIRVSMTLKTREEFVGYLLLGDKLSGDIYSNQDLELLEIISKELAVAILNAKAYAQIEEFNRTLQARVDHATNRLRVANRHLKELDRAKDEFISMASHQLRTPLTTIKGYLSMMLEGDAGKLNPSQKEFVGYAFGSSERMVNLISDLLNVSRLSAGRFLIQTKPTDMVSMIEDEVRQLKTHAKAKNIKLIFERPIEILPPAEIDENKTRQVVMNFIDNAIYYTPTGEVRVVLEQSGDRVRLEVRDSGIGVPEAAKHQLFSKFFRADNAQIVRPDGTGLGLYLAKRVVEDQGGTIIFNSVEGKGSTFGFELPFKPVTQIREVAHV